MTPRRRVSAGLLMFRHRHGELEVFIAHPGGPWFPHRDHDVWTIPKGELEPGEELISAATREFQEEVGLKPTPPFLQLGSIRQKGGKTVHAWAFEGDWDEDRPLKSAIFHTEWPPGSGKIQSFPEIDRVGFFTVTDARDHLKEAQHPFLDRLIEALAPGPALAPG